MNGTRRMLHPLQGEEGSVLLLTLLMLVVFTLLGGTFLTLAGTEGNIATNQQKGTQALYIAESGAHAAYREFAASNFRGRTHDGDGSIATTGILQPLSFAGELVRDDVGPDGLNHELDDGWYVWEWNPGDSGESISGSGLPESFRFSIRPASPAADEANFVIDVVGSVGGFSRRLQLLGYTEPAFTYALFSDGSIGEFSRAEDQTITGKIHANGDVFFRPWGVDLALDTPSFTATGRMIRTRDAWGNTAYSGNTVRIRDRSGNWVAMAPGNPGTAMDSQNPDWTNDDPADGVDGALELWDGIVRDGALGAVQVDAPPVHTLEPNGYYDENASLRILGGDQQQDASGTPIAAALGSVVTEHTFYNPNLQTDVTVQEIDVAALAASGYWPPNGLLYSEVPVRLVNAQELKDDLTIVSNAGVYTKGNFNSVNKRAAAIMTTARIWHVSDAWSDDSAYTHGSRNGRQASNGTTTINAAMLDGQPTINEGNWADLDGDGSPDNPHLGDAFPNNDNLLEYWGGSRTLYKRGSIVHMQFANMTERIDNTTLSPGEVAWQIHAGYWPPRRDYGYDPSLGGLSGQPPFAPLVSKLYLWQEITN
jgi:hypothetical protein